MIKWYDIRRALAATVLMAALVVNADVADLPVREINGRPWHCYITTSHDTLYSLQRSLGVDRATIVRYNPWVEDGLEAGRALYFPATEQSAAAAAKREHEAATTHVVQKGESVYGIARQYGVSVDRLIELNPTLSDGAKAGERIRIYEDADEVRANMPQPQPEQPREVASTETSERQSAPKPHTARETTLRYTIKSGETLYAIGKRYGVTTNEIIAANPGLNPTFYRDGQTIIIPVHSDEAENVLAQQRSHLADVQIADTTPARPAEKEETAAENAPVVEIVEEEEPALFAPVETVEAVDDEDNAATIAVLLPFMLAEKTQSKQAQHYTEFFKGFLLAIDSLRTTIGRPVHIYAYDTAASADTVRRLLRENPEIAAANVVIAPPDETQMKLVANSITNQEAFVLNPFMARDNSHTTNSRILQLNTPSADLVVKAVEGVTREYAKHTPVILRRNGARREHADFVDALKRAYLDADAEPVIITYDDKLDASHLERLAAVEGSLLFVPYEGKQTEADKILPALAEYAELQAEPGRTTLLGYPEWITFRGDTRKNMEKVGTVIYSRFFNDDGEVADLGGGNFAARKADEQFEYWYGSAPTSALPKQGYLGMDVGMLVASELLRRDMQHTPQAIEYDRGIQNAFSLHRVEGGGMVNRLVYLISYRPSGYIGYTIIR